MGAPNAPMRAHMALSGTAFLGSSPLDAVIPARTVCPRGGLADPRWRWQQAQPPPPVQTGHEQPQGVVPGLFQAAVHRLQGFAPTPPSQPPLCPHSKTAQVLGDYQGAGTCGVPNRVGYHGHLVVCFTLCFSMLHLVSFPIPTFFPGSILQTNLPASQQGDQPPAFQGTPHSPEQE